MIVKFPNYVFRALKILEMLLQFLETGIFELDFISVHDCSAWKYRLGVIESMQCLKTLPTLS